MNTLHYQAVVATPGFALGVRCCDDEVTAIEFLEPQPEAAADNPTCRRNGSPIARLPE